MRVIRVLFSKPFADFKSLCIIPFRSFIIVPCFRNITEVIIRNAQVALQIRVIRVLFRKPFADCKILCIIPFRSFIIVLCFCNIAEIIIRNAPAALQIRVIRVLFRKPFADFKSLCIIPFRRFIIIPCFRNITEFIIRNAQVALHLRVVRILFRKLFCNSQCRICSDLRRGVIKHGPQRIACINIAPNGFMRMVRVSAVFAFYLKYLCVFKVELRRSFMLPVIRIGFCEFFQCRGVFRGIRELFVLLFHPRTAQQA